MESAITPAKEGSSLSELIQLGKITGNFEQLNPQKVIVSGKAMFLICHQHKDCVICELEPFQSDDESIILQKIMSTALGVELFRRLDNVKNIQGTGVGLAIAKRIVEKHLGKIWLESQLNNGTKFYVAIPVKQAENA